jgi:hypothetical protein
MAVMKLMEIMWQIIVILGQLTIAGFLLFSLTSMAILVVGLFMAVYEYNRKGKKK